MTSRTAEAIIAVGRHLERSGLAHGTSGNISVRIGDTVLVTPTNSRLGALYEEKLSHVGLDGVRLAGPPPSKETPLHLNLYRGRPDATAVVHLHSTYCVAVSCLHGLDSDNALPALTAYSLMRLGRVALLPFHPPGSAALADAVAAASVANRAMLLSNHGSLVAGTSLDAATADAEEMEQTAKLTLLLRGLPVRLVPSEQAAALRALAS